MPARFNPSWWSSQARLHICICPLCRVRHRVWIDFRGRGRCRWYCNRCRRYVEILQSQYDVDIMNTIDYRVFVDVDTIASNEITGTIVE